MPWMTRMLALWLLAYSALAHTAIVLKIAAQEATPPKFIPTPSGTTGFCPDVLRAIERVDPNIRFSGESSFEPSLRMLDGLAAGRLDVACALAFTKERTDKAVFLRPPLFTTDYVLAARTDDPIVINSVDDLRKLGADSAVLGVRGMQILRRLAEQEGIHAEEGGNTPKANLEKLASGRGRFFLYRSVGMKTVIKEAGLEAKIRIVPAVIIRTELYMLASRHLPKAQVDELEQAIEKLKQSGELARIYTKWQD